MRRPDTIIIQGHAYSWKRICELRREQRREQLECWCKAQGARPALFALMEDGRPHSERSVAGRYKEPTLLTHISEKQRD